MSEPEDIEPGLLHMANRLQQAVWCSHQLHPGATMKLRTARIMLGSTPTHFDRILEVAVRKKLVYKTPSDTLTITPTPEVACHMVCPLNMEGVE